MSVEICILPVVPATRMCLRLDLGRAVFLGLLDVLVQAVIFGEGDEDTAVVW